MNQLIVVIVAFTLLISGCSKSNNEQQTEFITYTMAQFTRFDLSNKDKDYKHWLENTFGASAEQVDDVLEYAKEIRSMNQLEVDVNYQILKNVHGLKSDPQKEQLNHFMVNILTPYLWRARNENPVTSSAEELINARYVEYFGLQKGKNGLKTLINSFKQYQNGGYYSNDSLALVNNAIKEHGYYLKFDPNSKYVCLFDIDRTLYSKDSTMYPFDVYLIKRRIPCALPDEFGYSSVGASDVVVIYDNIKIRADKIVESINDSAHLYYGDFRAEMMWKSIGMDLNLTTANATFKKLAEMDFKNKSYKNILFDLTLETAIHEAKHKYDEQLDYNVETRINWDSEISAHLTEIMLSNSPYHSLMDAINRIEGFAFVEMDSNLAAMIKSLWSIAIEASENTISKEQLRSKVLALYTQYITYTGKSFAEINDFEKLILPSIWENIVAFNKEKQLS